MTNGDSSSRSHMVPEPGLTFLLLDCARLIRRHFNEQLADSGLTEPQWRVIALVARSEGLSQTELAILLGLHKVALGEQIDHLCQKGYLARHPDPADRRARRIFLTETACPLNERMAERFSEFTGRVKRAMGPDWPVLQGSLQQLAHRLCSVETLQALERLSLETSLYLVGVLSRLLGKRIDAVLKPHGLSRLQVLVLATVYSRPGISQTRLSGALRINKSALGQLLDALEVGAWLERRSDPADRRKKRLVLDAPACEKVARILAACAEIDQTVQAKLSPPVSAELVASLIRLRGHLTNI